MTSTNKGNISRSDKVNSHTQLSGSCQSTGTSTWVSESNTSNGREAFGAVNRSVDLPLVKNRVALCASLKVKKQHRPRAAVSSEKVAGELREMEEKVMGDIDALAELKKEDVVESKNLLRTKLGVDQNFCINPWAIKFGDIAKHFLYKKEGHKLYVQGKFNYNGEKNLFFSGYCELWDGVSADGVTDCKVLIATKYNDPLTGHNRMGEVPINVSSYDRVRESALSVIRFLVNDKGVSKNELVYRVKSHHVRFYGDYPQLEQFIDEYLNTKEFWDVYKDYQLEQDKLWCQITKSQIYYKYNKIGYSIEKIDKLVSRAVRNRRYAFAPYADNYNSYAEVLIAVSFILFSLYTVDNPTTAFTTFAAMLLVIGGYRSVNLSEDDCERQVLRSMCSAFPNEEIIARCSSIKILQTRSDHGNVGEMLDFSLLKNITSEKNPIVREKFIIQDRPNPLYTECYGTTMDVPFVIPENCPQNVSQALKIRMTQTRDAYDGETAQKYAKYFLEAIKGFGSLNVYCSEEENFIYLTGKYGQKKGSEMFEMRKQPLTEEMFKSGMFCKPETYLGKTKDNAKFRMIWMRNPILIAHFGACFNKLAKLIAKQLNRHTDRFYCSGSTCEEIGKYADSVEEEMWDPKEGDGSNWDGSLNTHDIKAERDFVGSIHGFPDSISMLLGSWMVMNGSAKSREFEESVDVELDYGRRSGDLWTSLFNSLHNIGKMCFALGIPANQVFGEVRGSNLKIAVNGDDNFFATRGVVDVDKIVGCYAKMGMKMNIISRSSMLDVEFCSGRFWKVNGRFLWGAMPFRTLSKFGINHGKNHPKMFPSLLYGMSKSMLPTGGHVPILGAFLRAIADDGQKRKLKARTDTRFDNPTRFGGNVCYPTMDTYMQFSEIYNMPVGYILQLEEEIEHTINLDMFPLIWTAPSFKTGFGIDAGLEDVTDNDTLYANILEDKEDDVELLEEIFKLADANSLQQAITNAWAFGKNEDEMFGTTDHGQLHVFFTILSWFNLELGVKAHKSYNKWAEKQQIRKCSAFPFAELCLLLFTMKAVHVRCMNKKDKSRVKKVVTQVVQNKQNQKMAKKFAKMGLTKGGSMLGGYLGGPAGMDIGRRAGSFVSKISGFGDYTVNKNTLVGAVPEFSKTGHSIKVRHREFLGDVTGSLAFAIKEYTLNPGSSATFPWLSGIAANYQMYQFHGLVFTFNSTSADALNSVNTALGTVIMGTKYNPLLPDFTSKIDMEAYEFSTSSKPSCSTIHPIECNPAETPFKQFYIRSSAVADGSDPRLYDLGVTTIATVGMQAAATIGELWVSYDVEFFKTKLQYTGAPPGSFTSITNGPFIATSDVLGSIQRTPVGQLGATVVANTSQYRRISFPERYISGRYLVIINHVGSVGAALSYYTITSSSNMIASSGADSPFFDLGINSTTSSSNAGVVATNCTRVLTYNITGFLSGGAWLDLSTTGVLPASPVSVSVFVVSLPQTNVAF